MTTGKPLRILIVEDEVLIALELEGLLQDAGHTVVGIATSRSEALALGQQLSPDLAFVDIHLGDGPTGVDVSRQFAHELGITVIFMTANAKRIPPDFAGARGVISKPYTERGVRDALAYVTIGHDLDDASHALSFVPFGRQPGGDASSTP